MISNHCVQERVILPLGDILTGQSVSKYLRFLSKEPVLEQGGNRQVSERTAAAADYSCLRACSFLLGRNG